MLPPQLLALAYRMLGHAAYLLAGVGSVAAVDLRNQITLASIVVTSAVIAVAGLFTIRSKIANVWREEAQGQKEKAERLADELAVALAERAAFERDQQELRHAQETQIAALTNDLKILEAKTDLTGALEAIRVMNETTIAAVASAVAVRSGDADERDKHTHELLEEIRDRLPAGS